MQILLCQLDGKLPNLALMRLARYHRDRGYKVEICYGAAFRPQLFRCTPNRVYVSVLFRKTLPLAEELKRLYPSAILGGTGVDPPRKGEIVPFSPVVSPVITSLEALGLSLAGERASELDYTLYPRYTASLGFTQRGCRLRCPFCCVGTKEGSVRAVQTVWDLWRGNPWPRHLHLLDNDFFGQEGWRDRLQEMREGHFRVSFNQGINARFLSDEAAEAIASVDYRNDSMETKRLYTAWDNQGDEERLFAGLRRLVRYGVRPHHIMVYVLCGYWPTDTIEQAVTRVRKLLDFGARPYPMPFVRTPELVGLQRWAIRAAAKRVGWHEWSANGWRPERHAASPEQASLWNDTPKADEIVVGSTRTPGLV